MKVLNVFRVAEIDREDINPSLVSWMEQYGKYAYSDNDSDSDIYHFEELGEGVPEDMASDLDAIFKVCKKRMCDYFKLVRL
jgi:hypothetical protein